MSCYGFVFARGGSKGLPGKNIKPLAGKPLIQYAIETSQHSDTIEQTFVSTDCGEIASIAQQAGAIVIERPAELAQDNSPEWLAWQHAIKWVEKRFSPVDEFVSLPATSPLRDLKDVEGAIDKRRQAKADVCLSVTPSNRNPYFNMVTTGENGWLKKVCNSDTPLHRRQDTPTVYDITTVVYAARGEFILNNNNLFEGKVTSIEVPKSRAVDIDDIYDFRFAEVLLEMSK